VINRMNLADKFRMFLNQLRIDNQEEISSRCREISRIVNLKYWKIKSDTRNLHYLGSYGRETAIKGLNNINILILLPYQAYQRYDSYPGNGQENLLLKVRDTVANSYSDIFINEEKCLIVPFPDGMRIEIIPGFNHPRKNLIIYPEPRGEGIWQNFNPIREIEVIHEYNYKYGGKVRHLARITRAWKASHRVPMPGMLIDTLVMTFMDEWEDNQGSYAYYGEMVQDFMEYLAGRKKEQLHWYAKGSNRIIQREEDFGAFAYEAFKKIKQALVCEEQGEEYNANQIWKEVFGDFFLPSLRPER
jgi:hypothetical protein